MPKLTFKDLSFKEEKDRVKVTFYKIFYFYLDKIELKRNGLLSIGKDFIEVKNPSKFYFLLEKGFKSLRNKISNRPSYYIHKNSGIPLIGTNYFGLIDRNTNIIEVKPITSCNLNCIYCSVDEGRDSKKLVDYVVEKDYLIEELKKLIDYKECNEIEVHINAHGEPLLYAPLVDLIKDIKKIKEVKIISVDTNGTLLNKKLVDDLAKAGLTRINLSLNAMDEKIAKKMANAPYNHKKIIEIAEYIPKKMDLIISPLYLPGTNDEEMEKLFDLAKKIGAGKNCPPIGIQNFLPYKFGRNPIKGMPMEEFFNKFEKYIFKEGFNIKPAKRLEKPFKKNQTIKVKFIMPGRIRGEMIAKADNRLISVFNSKKEKVKIKRTKHNIFAA